MPLAVFPPRDEEEQYIIVPHFWLTEETLQLRVRRDHVMYDKWERQGFIPVSLIFIHFFPDLCSNICNVFRVYFYAVPNIGVKMLSHKEFGCFLGMIKGL